MLTNYQLIDFGDGRRLEAIEGYRFDRPCPAAEGTKKSSPRLWGDASAIFQSDRQWRFPQPVPDELLLESDGFRLAVEPKPFGHLGFFPEQQDNWRWLLDITTRIVDQSNRDGCSGEPVSLDALNLFGYTGGTTLALASRRCKVVHVDASKPSVSWARENAQRSGLSESPIRYIVDDARKFVGRELRRGNSYDVIALDPPAYGHGKGGSVWKLQRDLWSLLEQCVELLSERSAMLITGHSESVVGPEITSWMKEHFREGLLISTGRATLEDRSGRKLDAGYWVRATWNVDED